MSIRQTISRKFSQYSQRRERQAAWLGDSSGNVAVAGKPHYCYARTLNGDTITIWNERVPDQPNLPIWIGYDELMPTRLHVLGARDTYTEPVFTGLPGHHDTHEWPAPDSINVWDPQIMPFRVAPAGGLSVRLFRGWQIVTSGAVEIETQDIDLSARVPADGALFVLICIDDAGEVALVDGVTVATMDDLTLAHIPAAPVGHAPKAAVRLFDGQGAVSMTQYASDIIDLRFSSNAPPRSADMANNIHSATVKSVPADADELPLADSSGAWVLKKISWANIKAALKVYFDGIYAALSHTHAAGDVTAGTLDGDRLPSMSASKRGGVPATGTPANKFLRDDATWQNIPASGGHTIQDEGAPLTQRAGLNFIGAQVVAADDSANNRTNITIDAASPSHTHNYQAMTGFPNVTDTSLSFNTSTRVFTIAPTGASFKFYSGGSEYAKSSAQAVTIANTIGQHFIYFDTSGVLQESTTPWEITSNNVPVATVYWSGSAGAIGEERHSSERNKEFHEWAHSTIGARYESGLAGTFTNTTLSIATGSIFDEDIEHAITTKTVCRLWYRAPGAASMTFESNIATPYKVTAGAIKWDNAGTLTSVSTSKYVCSWVYASNDIDYPIYITVGQAEHNTLADARAAVEPAYPAFGTREFKLLYKVIYQNVAGTATYIETDDYRLTSSLPGGGVTTLPASSVTFVPYGNIAATNAQAAIQELDDEKAPASQGVTNGNSHDHNGGDGGQIAYASLSGTPAVDPVAGVGGLRTLGTGAQQAAAGNHAHDHGALTGLGDDDHAQYNNYSCTAYHNAVVSIPNSTATILPLNSELHDDLDWHNPSVNNSRITVDRSGKYLILAHNISFAANANGFRTAYIYLNGSAIDRVTVPAVNGVDHFIAVTSLRTLNAGDYVEMAVYQSSGAALNMQGYQKLSVILMR